MGAIVSAISWAIGKVFADNLLRWIAFKALFAFLFIVVLPILFNNIIYDIIEIMFNFVNSKIGGLGLGVQSQTVTGVAGWLILQCKIGESMSVILGAVAARMSLNMIPFVRV